MRNQENDIIKKFQAMPWEGWLHRRMDPFAIYFVAKGGTRAVFAREGISGEFPIFLYDTDDCYSTKEMFVLAANEAEQYLKVKDIFTISAQCEARLREGRSIIQALIEDTVSGPEQQLAKVIDVILPINVYVWIAHAAEAYYHPRIREAVQAFVPLEQVETFIGDISFPSKKNALALMEEDIRAGVPLDTLYERYAWMKARGGFRLGYTRAEIHMIQEQTLPERSTPRLKSDIPVSLLPIVKEMQELVYFRTLRTDALYELYHRAQPIFQRFEKAAGIESVKDYLPDELLQGVIRKIPHEYAILKYYDEIVVTSSIMKRSAIRDQEIKGVVAFRGRVRGTVRILRTPQDSEKVQTGDILVTNMTAPSFVSAMRRAAAFVTNEGGITCHAAILAREMQKPCITGTKVATDILKDGDMVEVDAVAGTVHILA